MKVEPLAIPDVLLLRPRVARDTRGHFIETWSAERYRVAGIPGLFVQDNVSVSHEGVLRGLHFQHPRGQAKLVSVLHGAVFDVAVDVRRDSPTFRQWIGLELSAANGHQLFVPSGFAHGYLALSAGAVFAYKCTDYYAPEYEHSVRWDDPDLAIAWPAAEPVVTAKDLAAPVLSAIPLEILPVMARTHG